MRRQLEQSDGDSTEREDSRSREEGCDGVEELDGHRVEGSGGESVGVLKGDLLVLVLSKREQSRSKEAKMGRGNG